ncbi:MAG: hypothetical protein AMJ61_02020 [Desulfobacterales bacterium SG8_35_2]|nr:MAG: hypothetical protein AMJ61_02020 [Desulfobacterales bacterium SG8_35_2]
MLKPEQTEQQNKFQEEILSETALKDARDLVKVFLQAWKNYGLYPVGHATSSKSLQSLTAAFDDFLEKYGDLRLVVENNLLLWRGNTLHKIPAGTSADDLIFPLYRDGISWIEFQEGLPLEELAIFFSILKKFNSLQEEPEGDIVTELTDQGLAYIDFKAVDILWQDCPLLDFSTLTTPATENQETFSPAQPKEIQEPKSDELADTSARNASDAPAAETHTTASEKYSAGIDQQKKMEQPDSFIKSITDPTYNDALWKITPEEQHELQEMVQQEEDWDNAEDVFDVLIAILKSQTDKHNFSAVLDYTLEEVCETIEQGEFDLLLHLFQALHQMLYKDIPEESLWIRPLLERFFLDLTKPEIFDLINAKLRVLNDNDTEQIMNLRQVLLYFSPDAILFLGPVILQTSSADVQQMVLDVAEHLCLRDLAPLENILEHPDQKLGVAFLPILKLLRGERADKIYLKMVEHPSEKVRIQALKKLVTKDPQIVSKLFFLIDDPCEEIRKTLLAAIAMQKSSTVENLLLNYMKETLDQKSPEHILDCYEALSHCGSITAFQFLKRILLSQGWNSFKGVGKLIHRQGAATALALMDTREAKDILQEASRSKHQVIQQAVYAATARIEAQQGKSHA